MAVTNKDCAYVVRMIKVRDVANTFFILEKGNSQADSARLIHKHLNVGTSSQWSLTPSYKHSSLISQSTATSHKREEVCMSGSWSVSIQDNNTALTHEVHSMCKINAITNAMIRPLPSKHVVIKTIPFAHEVSILHYHSPEVALTAETAVMLDVLRLGGTFGVVGAVSP